jgi:2'-5' RNA ligase
MRAFLAVPSDSMWVESARGLVARLRDRFPRASWTKPESWHLTLKFLGEIDEKFVALFGEEIGAAALETVTGEIETGPAAVFPERGRPRVLGVGFSPSPGLESVARLARHAQETATRLGLPGEDRLFHAHVTFARIRDPWPPEAVEEYRREVESWPSPTWLARSCVLFESLLTPDGALHTPILEWTFQGGPRGVRA